MAIPQNPLGLKSFIFLPFSLETLLCGIMISATHDMPATVSRHLHHPHLPRPVHSFNPFPFMRFRAPMRDRNPLNSFTFIDLRTILVNTEGWGAPSFQIFEHVTFKRSLYFQQVTTIKFCNSPVLTTIRIAGGVGG